MVVGACFVTFRRRGKRSSGASIPNLRRSGSVSRAGLAVAPFDSGGCNALATSDSTAAVRTIRAVTRPGPRKGTQIAQPE